MTLRTKAPAPPAAENCSCGCHVHGAVRPAGDDGAGGRVVGVLALPLVWLVRLYQVVVSPLLLPSCRYYPSCSAYGLAALRRFGPVRGSWLLVRRLASCHPWASGGVDHVPQRRAQPPPGDAAGRPDPNPRYVNRCPHCAPEQPTQP